MSSQQQSYATPSMAKNDTSSPSYDPRITKSISVSSPKLLDECKTSGEELLGDAETVDGGECTVTEHSQGLPRRPILPTKSAGVPKFGSWGELDPSSDDGFTSIFYKVRDSKRTGIETSGGDDSEPPPPRRGTTNSGNECIQGGQDASDSCYVFATGNQIYFDNLWREDSEKDRSAPESVKQPGPADTKRHRWYQWWHIKR